MSFLNKIKFNAGKLIVRIKRFISPKFSYVGNKRRVYYKRFMIRAERRPIATFIGLLFILLLLIIISNFASKPKQASVEATLPVKLVQVYTIGASPKVSLQAQVEKSGVIKIVSLSSGVVQRINVEVGQSVWRGTNIVSMSTNYQGGNAFSVQRQLAGANYKNVLDTYPTQKDLIQKQKDLANKSDENSDRMRAISAESISQTQGLIDSNNNILTSLEALRASQEAASDPAVIGTKQMIAQLQAGNIQLQQSLKSTQYSTSDSNPPAQISDISKQITLDQLAIQDKALDLNKEVSRLNLTLAQITEALMFPSSPIDGTIERIYVKEGQVVNPGTPLVQVSGASKSLVAVALMSRDMAQGISRTGLATLHLGDQAIEEAPFYVSQEATDGQLYTAQFLIPQENSSQVTDKGYIVIDIPVDFPKTGGTIPFVPLDAVFQTQDQAFLFMVNKGKAQNRKIKLGHVLGSYVEVDSGLNESDQVILNRNVIEGDPVKQIN